MADLIIILGLTFFGCVWYEDSHIGAQRFLVQSSKLQALLQLPSCLG